ncbi:hypothetical protein H6F78_00500 [Coleofasciculus sp. FACHB-64]|uniref:hypothetical protein n=1 Tax=Cyanophyceae TaxID=3028117 RepID=UPI00168273EF|nr:hypothetical protein [Coleofasciculus sp. FACHB-64]MBD2044124.1 hypothetical protein [Coleofasciculus sp. FACHB-64]
MKILEHTSTRLTLQDSTIYVWFARLVGSLFLFIGCGALFLFIESMKGVRLDNLANIIEKSLPGIGFMIFFLSFGITFVFFFPKRTVWFDKENEKLVIKTERLLMTKTIEYPITDIASVIVEKNYSSNNSAQVYTIYLNIAFNRQKIRLSSSGFNKAKERANLIRSFLNMPL